MAFETEVFQGKSLSQLFSEIYDNSRQKDEQIKALIGELVPLIDNVGDATLVVPMIKEYLEIGVKNDEQLIKIATIVQRLETSIQKASGDTDWFSEGELQALLEEEVKIEEEVKEVEDKSTKLAKDGIQS